MASTTARTHIGCWFWMHHLFCVILDIFSRPHNNLSDFDFPNIDDTTLEQIGDFHKIE